MLKYLTNVAVFGTYLIVMGFLGFVLWQALFGAPQKTQGRNNQQDSHSEQQNTDKRLLGSSVAPTPHNPTEEAIADYTRWLAVFTALLVLATVALFYSGERNIEIARESADAAKKSADIATQTLIASSRPWLTMAPKFASDLTVNDNGIMRVAIALNLKNVGKSPANNLIYTVRFIPEYGDAANTMERLIAEMTSKKGSGEWPTNTRFGRSLFPDETTEATRGAQLDKHQVGESYRGVLGIAAVAAYVSEVTGARHYTYFFAGLDLSADGGKKILTFAEGAIPRESLRLGRPEYGQRDEYPMNP
jgi:hypothetical protein